VSLFLLFFISLCELGVLILLARLGMSMDEKFAKWDYFLQVVTDGYPAFLTALTEAMVDALGSATKDDAHCEGIFMWLDHILGSTQWESKRRLLSFAYVLSACEQNSNYWTGMLKERIRKEDNDLSSVPGSDGQLSGKDKTAPQSLYTGTNDDVKTLKSLGWEAVDTWDSRPLGIV
jgi:ribosomal biogenesis protein LAS1